MPTDTIRQSVDRVLERRSTGGGLRSAVDNVLERRRQPVEPADEIAGNAVTDPFERAITDRWADHELGHLDPSAAVQVEPSPKEPERRDVMRGLSAAMRDIERIRGQKTDRGAVQELVSRFSRGMYVGPLEGASGLFEMAGDVIQSEMLRDIGSAAELGSAAAGVAVPASDPGTRTTVGRFAGDVAEAAPQFAGQIGASIVGQFAGIPAPLTFAAMAVGPVVGSRYKEAKQFYLEQGRPDGEASMLAASEAMTDGLITYAVNQVGGKFLFNTPMGQQAQGAIKRLAGRIATGFVVEGGTEGAEKVLGDFTSGLQRAASEGDMGLLESMLTLQYWKDVGWEFGIGGVLGAGGGGAVHGTQVPRDTKEVSDEVRQAEAAEAEGTAEATEEVATPEAAEAVGEGEADATRSDSKTSDPSQQQRPVRADVQQPADSLATTSEGQTETRTGTRRVDPQETQRTESESRNKSVDSSQQRTAETAEGKQAWEMTEKEHRKRVRNLPIEQVRSELLGALMTRDGMSRTRAEQYIEGPEGRPSTDTDIRQLHTAVVPDAAVRAALSEGKPVPPEVLADYPDLQAQRESTDTEAVTVTEGEVGEAEVARPEGGPRRTGMVLVENVSNPAKAILKRNLTAAGDLPKRVFEQKIKGDGWINSQLFQTRSTLRDFDRAVKESYGTKKLSKEQKKKIDDVLKGDADPNTLPEPVRDAVAKMRMEVDAMSQKMIDLGVVEGKTAATVSENMGVYLTRSYRVFDDPKWADKVPRDVRNKAKALLRSEYPNRTDEEIDALIKNLLYEGKAAESPIALIRQAKLGSKDLSILTRRKGIAPEIRALWGEYRDPKQNYARSMAKMAHLVGNHQFLSTVRDEGLGVWFHEKPTTKDGVDYITRIAADESDVMRPLNGLYTSPEIKTAFEEAFASTQHGMAFQLYMRANATVKYSKTIGSVQTHIRNVLGNTGFAVANGHWRIAKAGNAWKTTLASLGGMSKTKWRDYYRELLEMGVVNESPRANELHDVIRDASNRDVDDWMETNALNVPRRVVKGAQAVYRAEDDVWKVYAYENELARYRKAWRGRPEQEIKERAAYIVRNTYPTYSLVPKAIKYLRRTPVVGTFVSFPWEVGRTAFHTVSIAAQELANPETRAIGAQRAAGALAAASLTPAIGIASRMILGMTSDDDEDMRRFLPPWSKNSNLVYIGRGENGKPLIVDLSYTDPHEYLKTPIIALMRGDNWQEAVFDSVKEATEPFFGEEILFGRVVDTLRNTTSTGGRIWNEQDTALQKTKDIVQHIGESLVPGTATSMNRIWKGLTGYVTPYGRGYDAKTEALATFTGHRVMEVDVPQSLSFAARRSSGELRDATSLFSTVAGRSGTVTPEEIEDAWNRMDSARRRIFEDASKDAQAAVRQGMKERDVLNTLNEAGWSKDNSRAILRGTYVPYKMSPAMKQRIIRGSEKLGGLTGENARTLMRERLEAISRARTSQERTSP